jgi:hypothetical protein
MNYLISQKKINIDNKVYQQKTVGNFFLYLKKDNFQILIKNKIKYYIFGHINGVYDKKLKLKKIKKNQIPKFLIESNKYFLDGVFTIIKFSPKNKIEIITDRFKRSEVYYSKYPFNLISSDLEIFQKQNLQLDQISVSHSLSIYGSRPMKSDTIFKNVFRVTPNQFIEINKNLIKITNSKFKPSNIKPYKENVLNNYSEAFLDTLKVKTSKKINIIYLSSGWDSTAILAGLVKIIGKEKIRCVIGKMRYSEDKCANLFEIKKAKKICKFFGVKLLITDFDYYKPKKFMNKDLFKFLAKNQLASVTAVNHYYLAKYVHSKYGNNCSVFCGEISDGAHNLGFSQYATMFHPSSYSFREYSDKMNSYLFGPTFLNYAYTEKDLKLDPVFSMFYNLNTSLDFNKVKGTKRNINLNFLNSFFLRSTRLPFVSKKNLKLLTQKGQDEYQKNMEGKIIKKFSDQLNSKNIYSIILHMYHFFHWQGSTVLSFEKTCEHFNLKAQLPFLDMKILDILSTLPEQYGRGLDFNNTKFLLKEMLKKKIKYPNHLQKGPHSYLYDTDRTFNHTYELLYRSGIRKILLNKINTGKFVKKLNNESFKQNYINYLVKSYKKNRKLFGQELNDLFSLLIHELVYSELNIN